MAYEYWLDCEQQTANGEFIRANYFALSKCLWGTIQRQLAIGTGYAH